MSKYHWIVCDSTDQTMKCLRCGTSEPMRIPAPVTEFCKQLDVFGKQHTDCTPKNTWRTTKQMKGIGYWWDVVSRWPALTFDTWLEKQNRETLISMLQETDPNGIWTDELALMEMGYVTSLEDARAQMRTWWKESIVDNGS